MPRLPKRSTFAQQIDVLLLIALAGLPACTRRP
jgi:hypothetical protein